MSPEEAGLERFEHAHAASFDRALAEIPSGRKRSHWMWFVFPQVRGLGSSATARRFAIRDREEAVAFLEHPVLGRNDRIAVDAVAREVLEEGTPIGRLFAPPDDLKLVSSLTLFVAIAHSLPLTGDAEARWVLRAQAVLEAAQAEGYPQCGVTERFLGESHG